MPTVDSTDFYMFNSYEPGRKATSRSSPTTSRCRIPTAVLTISRWTAALYEIHIDNDGDARENLTFQFRFTNRLANDNQGIKLNIGGTSVAVPLKNVGRRRRSDNSPLNFRESYTVTLVRGDRRSGKASDVTALRMAARRSASPTTSSAPRPSAASKPTRPTRAPSSTTSTFRAATCRAACSSASARKASR